MKVVFHVSESSRFQVAIGNINNFLDARRNAIVEFVVNSEAVTLFKDEAVIEQVRDITKRGVKVYACRNALRANQMSEDQLSSYVGVVPAGVVYLVEKQHDGFAYIKS